MQEQFKRPNGNYNDYDDDNIPQDDVIDDSSA